MPNNIIIVNFYNLGNDAAIVPRAQVPIITSPNFYTALHHRGSGAFDANALIGWAFMMNDESNLPEGTSYVLIMVVRVVMVVGVVMKSRVIPNHIWVQKVANPTNHCTNRRPHRCFPPPPHSVPSLPHTSQFG